MTMQRDVHDELRARLHGAAEAHEPDRARILARVERGMAAQGQGRRADHRATRPPLWGWTRIVGATAAVAGMLAVGGYAVASAVKGDAPAQQTVSVSSPPVGSPDATSRPPASPGATPGSGGGAHHPAKPSARPSKSAGATPSAPAATLLPATGAPRTARCGRTARSTRTATTSGRRATSRSRRPSSSRASRCS